MVAMTSDGEYKRASNARMPWNRQVISLLGMLRYRDHVSEAVRAVAAYSKMPSAECPCCGHRAQFESFGSDNALGARCPSCGSLQRHRLLALAMREGAVDFAGADLLHFAPEPVMTRMINAAKPKSYLTADITPGRADVVLNLETIAKPDASFDMIVASHVLEHVDDALAMAELYRILRPGGALIAMVPIVEGWADTYEDRAIADDGARADHYGQYDHVRYYGRDFRDRLGAHGFRADEYTALGSASVMYALTRGEKVFIGSKPPSGLGDPSGPVE